MIAILRHRFAIFALVAGLIALALPAVASATSYSFTVNYTGSGEVFCKVTEPGEELREEEFCDGPWPANTRITFEAPIPETGSEFVGFQNGTGSAATPCSGKKTCSFKLEADSSIEVRFDLIMYTLTITVDPEGKGAGEVECEAETGREPCEGTVEYPEGTELSLYAEAEWGSKFAGFRNGTGSAEGCAGAECTFTIEKNSTVEAQFDWFSLLLGLAGTGAGTVTSSPAGIDCGSECKYEFEALEPITLTAHPAPGSSFVGFSGGPCESEAPGECTVTLEEADATVTATFDLVQHQLSVSKSGTGSGTVTSTPAGINCGGTCAAAFGEGGKVTLKATPASGSSFAGWSGGGCPGTGNCTVTLNADATVTATFDLTAKPKSTLTVTKSGAGTGKVHCDGGACASSYRQGTTVTLAATAAFGSAFSGWSGAGCSGAGACVVTIEGDTAITATFDKAAAPPPLPGTAKAAATAKVSGNNAPLMLTCTGGGPCKGTLKFTAKVRQGHKRKNLIIGKASFQIAAGKSKTVKVKITNGQIRKQLGKGHTVTARLKGSGVMPRTVKLKGPKRISRR